LYFTPNCSRSVSFSGSTSGVYVSTLTLKKPQPHAAARPIVSEKSQPKFDPINEFLGAEAVLQMRNGTRYQGKFMHLRGPWLQIDNCLISGSAHDALVTTVFVKVLDQVSHVHGEDVVVGPRLQGKELS
jgi:hypothetical protein